MFIYEVSSRVECQQLASQLAAGDFIQLPAIPGYVYTVTAINKIANEVSVLPVGTICGGFFLPLVRPLSKFKFSGSTLVHHVDIKVIWPPKHYPES